MAEPTPIRKRTLWENHDMTAAIVDMMEATTPLVPKHHLAEHEAAIAEGRRDVESLRARAELLEGPREH